MQQFCPNAFVHGKIYWAEPSPADGLPRAAMRVVAASFDHDCSQYPPVEGNDSFFSVVDPGHDPKPATIKTGSSNPVYNRLYNFVPRLGD